MTNHDLPEQLIEQLLSKAVVAFIGSGLSTGAGFPKWDQLLADMMNWAEDYLGNTFSGKDELLRLIDSKRYLVVAEELRDRLGDEQFKRFLQLTFHRSAQPTAAHRALTEIPFTAILTTNFDTLLEQAYESYAGECLPIYTHTQIPQLAT